MKLKLDQIIIGERQRLDLGDLTDLDSMSDKEVGQIQPITVHKLLTGYELVDGRRRLAKATQLGWTEINAHEKDQLTPSQKNKMELFADIGRKDRSWQEVALAISKIHYMMRVEKAEDGIRWTDRATAQATGYSKGRVNYYLRVADALQKEPRDEQIWECGSYIDAFKVLVQRQHDQVRTEMEVRRAKTNVEQLTHNLTGKPLTALKELAQIDNIIEVANSESTPAQSLGKSIPERPRVYIHGYPYSFEDAKPSDLFAGGFYLCIVPPGPDLNKKFMDNVRASLRDEGLAVIWGNARAIETTMSFMPFNLIWNQILPVDSLYPWSKNFVIGTVFGPRTPQALHESPLPAVVAATPESDGSMPASVIDHCLICPPNAGVLCPLDAPVLAILDSGRVPIWFESSPEKFEAKCQAIKEHYERLIPDVEVIRKTE